MRETSGALLGAFAFVVAGFIHGGLEHSADPELVLAASYGFAAFGLFLILAGGVALGIRIARE